MPYETAIEITELGEIFNVSATCQECLDSAIAKIDNIKDAIEFTGRTAALHCISSIADGTVITNRTGQQVNGIPAFNRC